MKQAIRKWFLLGFPLLLGAVGFLLAGRRPMDALFASVCLYGLGIPDSAPNLLVELARWTAPVATAGGVLLIFSSLGKKLKDYRRYRR